jgi:hypothetical protein
MWLSSVVREIKLGMLLETLSSTTNFRNVTFVFHAVDFRIMYIMSDTVSQPVVKYIFFTTELKYIL